MLRQEIDLLVLEQQHQDLLRQINQKRLCPVDPPQYSAPTRLIKNILRFAGTYLVAAGAKLQQYGSVPQAFS